LRLALIVAVYLIAFTILDFITKQFEGLPGVVTWYPPAGLTYALLLVFGVAFTPAVTIALFISSLFTYRMPQAPYLLLLWAFVISLIYGLGAAFLRKRIHIDWQLRKLRDVAWFVCTTVLVSALLAVLSVSSSALTGAMPRSEVLRAIFDWWIGETVGVLTVTPFLLIFVMPALKRFVEGQPVRLPARRSFPPPTLSAIGQAASIVLTLYLVFGAPALAEFHPLFLISLPLIWIALTARLQGHQRGTPGVEFRGGVGAVVISIRPGTAGRIGTADDRQLYCRLADGRSRHRTQTGGRNSIFDNAAEGIFQSTPEGKFLTANPAMAHILGFSSPEELIRERTDIARQSYVDPAQREEFKRLMEQQNKISGFEYAVPRKDGSVAWVSETTQAVRDATGRIVYYDGIFMDITERRRTESERQSLLEIMQGVASTESLDELLELIRQSLAKVIYAENFFVAFKNKDTGLFEEVYAVDKYDPAMPPSKLEKSMISYVFRTGESLLLTQAKFEELVRRGEAELIGTQPAIWMGAPLKTPHETIGVIAVQNYEAPDCYSERDKDFLTSVSAQVAQVIERKRTGDALHESEERYRNLFQNNHAVTLIIDPDSGAIVDANPAASSYYGWDHEELLKKNIEEINTLTPEEVNVEMQLARTEKRNHFFFKHRLADGTTRDVEAYSGPLVIFGKTLLYSMVHDISERKKAEEALSKSEEKYRTLVDEVNDGFYMTDEIGTFTFANPALAHIYGFEMPQDLLGRKFMDFIAPELLVAMDESTRNKMHTGSAPEVITGQIVRLDGTRAFIEAKAVSILQDGKIVGSQGVVRDITERKKATETLQKSEKRFRALIEHSMEEISLVNSDGTLTWESPTTNLPLGYPANSLVGHNLLDLFHPDERAAATRLLEQIGQHPGSVHEASFRLRHQDGSWHWIEGILTNLLDEPAVQSVVINYRDVTEHKQREDKLRYQADLIESVSDAIVATDAQYQLTAWNAAAEALYGWKAEEVLGRNGVEIIRTEWPAIEADIMRTTIAETGHWHGEATQARRDGTRIPVGVSSQVLRNDSGQITGYVSLNRDITDRVRAEEQIKQRLAELEAVNQISTALRAAQTLDEMLPLLLDTTLDVLHATRGAVWLYDPVKNE
jgi:PAS domain S-box-containing protein